MASYDPNGRPNVSSPNKVVHPADWYDASVAKLIGYRKSSSMEDSSEWPGPSPSAIANATEFLDKLHDSDMPPSTVSQSAIGGIAFTFLSGGMEVFVEFLNNGNVFAVVSKPDDVEADFPTYQVGKDGFGYDGLIEIIANTSNA